MPEIKSIDDIPGWFPWIDQVVFERFLSAEAVVPRGDLVELGVYLGKSAAFIGRFKRPDEVFTVCDLFGRPANEDLNRRENTKSYPQLDRTAFERNYLSLFDELPVVVQDFSSAIVEQVDPGCVRFLHVDASHMYEHVAVDVDSARRLLLPDGVVAFDDYRSDHTPGVSAAVWEAVFTRGLRPICLTQQKLYGTFGDSALHQEHLRTWLSGSDRTWSETQTIAGAPVLRIAARPAPKASTSSTGDVDKRLARIEQKLNELQRDSVRTQPLSTALVRRVRRKVKERRNR